MEEIIIEIVNAPLESSLLLVLSVAYMLVTSVRIYDARLIQSKMYGLNSSVAKQAEGRILPTWINAIHWMGWCLFILIAVLNWKYAIALYAVFFLLKVLPALELIGSVIARPFLKKGKRG